MALAVAACSGGAQTVAPSSGANVEPDSPEGTLPSPTPSVGLAPGEQPADNSAPAPTTSPSGGEPPSAAAPLGDATPPAGTTSEPTGTQDTDEQAPEPAPLPEWSVISPAGRGFSGFVSLDNPVFLTAASASYLSADDLVLGLEWRGEARAYPLEMAWFHHIINDTVLGWPVLVTF